MTEEELQAIEKRLADARDEDGSDSPGGVFDLVFEDVPKLLAEIRRLRTEREAGVVVYGVITEQHKGQFTHWCRDKRCKGVDDTHRGLLIAVEELNADK